MKIPKCKKLPSGSFFIQLRLGGKSIPVTAPTERECIAQAQLIKARYVAGEKLRDQSSDTLGAIVDEYIASREPVLSPSTIVGYRNVRKNRFLAYWGKPTDKIVWQRMINAETAIVSAKTVKNAWGLVSAALDCAGQEVPKVKLPTAHKNAHPFLTPEQIPIFMEAIRGSRFELAALLGLCSLRKSEIFGLRKENVNLAAGTITVCETVLYDGGVAAAERRSATKTSASRRVVPIMIPRLAELLAAAPDDELIDYHPNLLYRGIASVCEEMGIPNIGIHGLRHSFASLAYHLGVSERVAMQIGGWSDISTMHRIYTHIAEQDIGAAAEALQGFFANENANGAGH